MDDFLNDSLVWWKGRKSPIARLFGGREEIPPGPPFSKGGTFKDAHLTRCENASPLRETFPLHGCDAPHKTPLQPEMVSPPTRNLKPEKNQKQVFIPAQNRVAVNMKEDRS